MHQRQWMLRPDSGRGASCEIPMFLQKPLNLKSRRIGANEPVWCLFEIYIFGRILLGSSLPKISLTDNLSWPMCSPPGDARGAFLTEQFWRLISLSPYFTASHSLFNSISLTVRLAMASLITIATNIRIPSANIGIATGSVWKRVGW